jgi:hypothetical protein
MNGDGELLERFKPVVLYDSLEAFFADSPAEMTDNPGNRLLDASGNPVPSASSGLSLEFLGSYEKPDSSHRLSIKGRDYRSQYVRLIAQKPELRDWVFGRVHPVNDDTKWLQYWFFYFYDDPSMAMQLGAHEGDWEMIQLRVLRAGEAGWEPDVAVYAQHKYGSQSGWLDVERDGDRPIVYSARGSHASYFHAGLYDTEWFDVVDGKGPRRDLRLMVIEDKARTPAWAYWPGHWGDTRPGEGMRVTRLLARIKRVAQMLGTVQATSPDTPCRHGPWKDPDAFLHKATERDALTPTKRHKLPSEASVSFDRVGTRLRYRYDTPPDWQHAPVALVVTVEGDPPRTFTVALRGARRGNGTVPWLKLDPEMSYKLRASLRDEQGHPSSPFPSILDKGPARWRSRPIGTLGYMLALAVQPIWQLRARLRALSGG